MKISKKGFWQQDLLPSHPGRASTLYSNTFICGMILAGPMLGIGSQLGYRVSFIIAAALSVAGLVLLAVSRPEHAESSREPITRPG